MPQGSNAPPAAPRAVFCDLDGTLFTPSPGHTITKRTTDSIRRLQRDKGVPFIVATGRPYSDVFANLAFYEIAPDFYITSNGARVHDKDRRVVYEQNMDPAVVLDLLQMPWMPRPDGSRGGEEGGEGGAPTPRCFTANVNSGDRWFTDRCLPEVRAVFHPSFAYEQVNPAAMTVADLTGTHSMWLRGLEPDLALVEKYICQRYSGRVSCRFALSFILDVFPSTVHKGHAVEQVCGLLGIDPADTAAFGDGMNDEPMLARVGRPFVLGNAPQKLKDAVPAAEVIGTNGEEAVAATLEAVFQL